MDQLRRQVRDEVEKPMRDLLDAANSDADRYRADSNKASRELVVVRSELDQLRSEHCRNVAELKLRLDTQVSRLSSEVDFSSLRRVRASLEAYSSTNFYLYHSYSI